jgi:hypothetical protein
MPDLSEFSETEEQMEGRADAQRKQEKMELEWRRTVEASRREAEEYGWPFVPPRHSADCALLADMGGANYCTCGAGDNRCR